MGVASQSNNLTNLGGIEPGPRLFRYLDGKTKLVIEWLKSLTSEVDLGIGIQLLRGYLCSLSDIRNSKRGSLIEDRQLEPQL